MGGYSKVSTGGRANLSPSTLNSYDPFRIVAPFAAQSVGW